MTSSATSRPHLPGASTRPQSVKPSVLWAYVGAAMAVVGVVLAVSLVAIGFLSDGGPEEVGRADFPGQVTFESAQRDKPLAIYLERSTLSGDPGVPGYLTPIVTRGDGEVPIDTDAKVDRHAGVSTEMIPIGSFVAVGGEYTVTVDPDGSSDNADAAIVVADPDVAPAGTALIVWGAAVGAGLFLVGVGITIGVGRARDPSAGEGAGGGSRRLQRRRDIVSPHDGALQPAEQAAQSKAMRWSMGLLFAAGISVMVGFLATQLLTGRSVERLGPSSDAVARERVPSSEKLRIDRPGTYDLFYEQAAPSTGVPGSLDVSVRSDRGDLGLGTPDPVLSAVIDDRSYVAFRTVRIRAGTYTLDVKVKDGEPAGSLFEDDRIVVDRANREADALWMLLGLAPAAAGLALAACLAAASVWVRARNTRAGRVDGKPPSGGPAIPGRWGPSPDHAFRDPPPPPEFPEVEQPTGTDSGERPSSEGKPRVDEQRG